MNENVSQNAFGTKHLLSGRVGQSIVCGGRIIGILGADNTLLDFAQALPQAAAFFIRATQREPGPRDASRTNALFHVRYELEDGGVSVG